MSYLLLKNYSRINGKPSILLAIGFNMPAAKIIISILLLMVVVTFAVMNMNLVQIQYYDFQFHKHILELPLLAVIFSSLLIGFILAWFAGSLKQIRLRSLLRKSDRAVRSLTEQIEKYKARE